jgi:hypothetical protein
MVNVKDYKKSYDDIESFVKDIEKFWEENKDEFD